MNPPQTFTKPDYSPEAEEVLSRELALFLGQIEPQLGAYQGDVLQGLTSGRPETTRAGAGLQHALDAAQVATRHAGQDAALPPTWLSQIAQAMAEMQPTEMAQLMQLFDQIGLSTNLLLDPRYAGVLQPSGSKTSTPTGKGDKALQASNMLLSVVGAASAAGA